MTTAADSALQPWPFYAADETAAALAVLQSGRVNYWTGGEGCAFENEYAAHCGVKYGIAVANGTLALELALRGYGIGEGDDVIVPARTFIATAAAVVNVGAKPVVCDIDPVSLNLTAETVKAALTPRTKAAIPVHLSGWPVDMPPLMDLAAKHNLKVIEDCAQAHGARSHGKPVGGIGHAGCFSFCQDKIITTGGEGGMVVTNNEAAYRRMWAFRDHGRDYDAAHAPDPDEGFRWLVTSFGTNWRMTEMQAAIGRIQLRKLSDWIARRRAITVAFDAALGNSPIAQIAQPPATAHHSYYKYIFQIRAESLKPGWNRYRIIKALNALGVPARVGPCPNITHELAFAPFGLKQSLPNADASGARTIMLPVHPTLTDGNIVFIIESLRKILTAAALPSGVA